MLPCCVQYIAQAHMVEMIPTRTGMFPEQAKGGSVFLNRHGTVAIEVEEGNETVTKPTLIQGVWKQNYWLPKNLATSLMDKYFAEEERRQLQVTVSRRVFAVVGTSANRQGGLDPWAFTPHPNVYQDGARACLGSYDTLDSEDLPNIVIQALTEGLNYASPARNVGYSLGYADSVSLQMYDGPQGDCCEVGSPVEIALHEQKGEENHDELLSLIYCQEASGRFSTHLVSHNQEDGHVPSSEELNENSGDERCQNCPMPCPVKLAWYEKADEYSVATDDSWERGRQLGNSNFAYRNYQLQGSPEGVKAAQAMFTATAQPEYESGLMPVMGRQGSVLADTTMSKYADYFGSYAATMKKPTMWARDRHYGSRALKEIVGSPHRLHPDHCVPLRITPEEDSNRNETLNCELMEV